MAKQISGIAEFASENDITEIERILRFGPECIDDRDGDGMTGLHWACVCGYDDLARLLLDKGANTNTRSGADSTPMQDAARNGSIGLVRLLAERGADITATDRDGNTILHEAVRNNSVEVASFCLDAGVAIDIQTSAGNTPLHYACMWGALETMALLIDRGAAIDITNNAEKTVLDVMLCINDAVKAKVLAAYTERVDARQLRETEEQQRLDAERVKEARAARDAKAKQVCMKKQEKNDQGPYAIILNKKKIEAQRHRESLVQKQFQLENDLGAEPMDDEYCEPDIKLPPIKKASNQKSISSPNDHMIRRRKKNKSPSKQDLLAGL